MDHKLDTRYARVRQFHSKAQLISLSSSCASIHISIDIKNHRVWFCIFKSSSLSAHFSAMTSGEFVNLFPGIFRWFFYVIIYDAAHHLKVLCKIVRIHRTTFTALSFENIAFHSTIYLAVLHFHPVWGRRKEGGGEQSYNWISLSVKVMLLRSLRYVMLSRPRLSSKSSF